MADYVTDYPGPKFEAANPGVSVRVIGTGPSDAGPNAVMERLEAQMKAGTEADIDVAVSHQKQVSALVQRGLRAQYNEYPASQTWRRSRPHHTAPSVTEAC